MSFSKSLSSMRQKLRKYLKDFEADISKFRENPDQPDDDEEEEKRKFLSPLQLIPLTNFKDIDQLVMVSF